MTQIRTHSPTSITKYMHRPIFVNGGNHSVSVGHSIIRILSLSPIEGGIVQNMPSEARVGFMGPLDFLRGYTRVFDYITENTGRTNTLGNQPQDNCILSLSSQRMIPSSKGLGLFKQKENENKK